MKDVKEVVDGMLGSDGLDLDAVTAEACGDKHKKDDKEKKKKVDEQADEVFVSPMNDIKSAEEHVKEAISFIEAALAGDEGADEELSEDHRMMAEEILEGLQGLEANLNDITSPDAGLPRIG